MGLLALAAQARSTENVPRFTVLTVDHGLRKAAAVEAAQVATQCEKLNLPHVTLKADETLAETDIQQQARNLRYRLMAAWCMQNAAQALVLAHHRDDQAETVLMRMARGSGLSGLGGMAPRQVLHTQAGPILLVRPLLNYGGVEVKGLAHAAGLPVIDDPSNDDPKFERVRWRRLLPRLQAVGLRAAQLADMAAEMRLLQAALDKKLTAWLDDYAAWHEYGVLSLPRADFDALPFVHKQRFMGRFVQYFGQYHHPVKQSKTDRLLQHIDETTYGAASLGGLHMRWRKNDFFLGREAAACPASMPMRDMISLSDGQFDRRFDFISSQATENVQMGALGARGVAEMRARGAVFDKAVPAAYYAALPGIFDGDRLLACPVLAVHGEYLTEVKLSAVYYENFYRDIIAGGRG